MSGFHGRRENLQALEVEFVSPAEGIEFECGRIPDRLTPGAAEAMSVRVYRPIRTENLPPADALRLCLGDYRPAIAADVMEFQIQLALAEASDASFIPAAFRTKT